MESRRRSLGLSRFFSTNCADQVSILKPTAQSRIKIKTNRSAMIRIRMKMFLTNAHRGYLSRPLETSKSHTHMRKVDDPLGFKEECALPLDFVDLPPLLQEAMQRRPRRRPERPDTKIAYGNFVAEEPARAIPETQLSEPNWGRNRKGAGAPRGNRNGYLHGITRLQLQRMRLLARRKYQRFHIMALAAAVEHLESRSGEGAVRLNRHTAIILPRRAGAGYSAPQACDDMGRCIILGKPNIRPATTAGDLACTRTGPTSRPN